MVESPHVLIELDEYEAHEVYMSLHPLETDTDSIIDELLDELDQALGDG